MLWLLSASVLLIGTVFAVLHFRAREWMRHVAVIESHGGTIYGYSSAPDWLLRLASDESEYLGYSYTEPIGPDWLRRHLPTDTLLRSFDTVDCVELGQHGGLHIHSNLSGSQPVLSPFTVKSPGPVLTASVLRHLDAFPHLKRLNLREASVDDSGLEGLEGLTSLEELLLSNIEISDAGLKHLENLSRLRRLDLADTNVTDADLASIGHLRKLEVLDLCSTDVHSKGLKELAPLQELKWLDLRTGDIHDDEFAELATLTKLRFLFVSGEDLTAAGIAPLKRLKDLRVLRVDLTDPEVDKLRSMLATVDIKQGTMSMDMGSYEDLLNLVDDPAFDGGRVFLQQLTDKEFEAFLNSMPDLSKSNEVDGSQRVGGGRIDLDDGLGF
jgi:hypothetical protein